MTHKIFFAHSLRAAWCQMVPGTVLVRGPVVGDHWGKWYHVEPVYYVGSPLLWNVGVSTHSSLSVSLNQMSDKILITAEWIYKTTALLSPQWKLNTEAKHGKIAWWNNAQRICSPLLEYLDICHENNNTPHSNNVEHQCNNTCLK